MYVHARTLSLSLSLSASPSPLSLSPSESALSRSPAHPCSRSRVLRLSLWLRGLPSAQHPKTWRLHPASLNKRGDTLCN